MRLRPAITVVRVLVPSACALAAGAPAQVVRDSAGVQVITNAAPLLPAAAAWRLESAPFLQVGGLSADSLDEVDLVMGVGRLGDGRWAVAVQASSAVRFYDARGRFTGHAGRKGDGPGEFPQILGMQVLRGDTLLVVDNTGIQYFSAEGRFVRQGAGRRRAAGYVYPKVVLEDGSYVGVSDPGGIPPAGRARPVAVLRRVSADGARSDSILTVEWAEQVFDGRRPYGIFVVFGSATVLGGGAQRLLLGSPTRPEIAEHAPSGALRRLIRLARERTPVTGTHQEAYRAYRRAAPGEDGRDLSPAMREFVERQLERVVFAEALPFFGSILTDGAGHTWAQRYDYRQEFRTPGPVRTQTMAVPSVWDVIDGSGRWLCTVEMPARFTPLEIGVDYVAGLSRDEDDVEYVRAYRLVKPGAGR